MKKLLALLLAAVMVLSLAACGGSSAPAETKAAAAAPAENDAPAAASNESIALTLWGGEEDQDLLKELVEEFKAAYPDQTFNISIGVESESTAKDTILTDIEAAADVFAFADDQLAALVSAGALQSIDEMDPALQAYAGKSVDDIKAANSAGSVTAATANDTLYAFPMSGGNGYFLYYDSTVVSPEQAQSWDGILEAANAAGKKVGMTLASGWYNASFFLGAGFTTSLNADGTTYIDWNGTSSKGFTGVQVVQSMLTIAGNPAFQAVPDGSLSGEIAAGGLCAVVDGTWDAGAAEAAFGEGYAATKLPTFTCNGQQVQQGDFAGFKLVGVNAHSKNAGWATLLAEFLTNEASQAKRFTVR
ncbi:MAG: extracellular solute-binding protein, partial [Faecousia sp.]